MASVYNFVFSHGETEPLACTIHL